MIIDNEIRWIRIIITVIPDNKNFNRNYIDQTLSKVQKGDCYQGFNISTIIDEFRIYISF